MGIEEMIELLGLTTSPFKGGHDIGVTLSYLQAGKLKQPLVIHPLLECKTWDPSESCARLKHQAI